ncbi:MAG: AAA family ATPase, partial [Salibacteraceae bacterium]
MLKHLLVRHFALIDHLEVDFSDGLTIITGETGAGKSILLGALGHILGQRADSKSVQEGAKKCIIEGAFAIERYALEGFFREHDLDYEAVTTLRREI